LQDSRIFIGWREAGQHQVTFDGSHLPSGLYFCRMQAGEFKAVRKMVMVRYGFEWRTPDLYSWVVIEIIEVKLPQ
jgi:hypothetical protein